MNLPISAESLSESDIRPPQLMEEKKACLQWDVDFLLSQKHLWVNVPCPGCGSACAQVFGEKAGFSYDQCSECGTIFTNPRPSLDVLHRFYAQSRNYDYWNRFIFPLTENARRQHIFRPRALSLSDWVSRLGIANGTMIEIGAAFGWFCQEIKSIECFDRVIAVEPTPGLAATCRGKGIETFEMPVENLDLSGIADVVACFEVIEHLFSVSDFLRQCSRLLKTNGLLILTCPNSAGFDVGTLGLLSNTFDHEHLNYFTTESLTRLIAHSGFRVLSVETPGKLDVDIVKRFIDDGSLDISNNFLLRRIYGKGDPNLMNAFQTFLKENLMSSHMSIVCQKN